MKTHLLLTALFCTLLPSCGTITRIAAGATLKVIHALADQGDLPSPLRQGVELVAQEITFPREKFVLSRHQASRMAKSAPDWKATGKSFVIAGFAGGSLPPDYARSLAQRRAEAVRSALVEAGIDADKLHATGYGNDIPGLAKDMVRIYAAH